jgi:hypothetical protein
MAEDDYIKICPKCGSDNVSFERNPAYVAMGLLNQFGQCDNCGFHGQIFPEVPISERGDFAVNVDKVEKRQLVQTAFGKGYLNYFLFIELPISFIYFIILCINH